MATTAAPQSRIENTMAQRCLKVFERNLDGATTVDRQTMIEVLTDVCDIDEESANLLLGRGGGFVDWHAFVDWLYGQKGARPDFLQPVENGEVVSKSPLGQVAGVAAAKKTKGSGLRFDDSAPVELEAASAATAVGAARAVRGRVNTGFIFEKQQQDEVGGGHGTRFSSEPAEELEAASQSAGLGRKALMGRTNTGFVRPEEEGKSEETRAAGGLRFAAEAEELAAASASTAADGTSPRSVRARINTGFVHSSVGDEEQSGKALKFDGAVQEMEAASAATEGPKRSVRARVNTGFVKDSESTGAGDSTSKPGLRFDGGVQELDAASEATGVPTRKVRARVNTGFAFSEEEPPAGESEERRLQFNDDAEELQAASSAAEGPTRSARARVNTGFVHESSSEKEKEVQFDENEETSPAASPAARTWNRKPLKARQATGYEPIQGFGRAKISNDEPEQLDAASAAAEGGKRELRGRVNTGFAYDTESDEKKLQFNTDAEELQAASEAVGGPKRSVRARVNTGFAFDNGPPEPAQASSLKFDDNPEELQAASEAVGGPKRSVRARVNTGFAFDNGPPEPAQTSSLKFDDNPEELQAASEAVGGPKRSVRARVNTGFAFESSDPSPPTASSSGLRFSEAPAEQLQAASEAAEGPKRSVRARVNTGFAFDSGGVSPSSPSAEAPRARLQFDDDAEELDAASAGVEGPKRSTRARVNTGFAFGGPDDAQSAGADGPGLRFNDEAEELNAASEAAEGPKRAVRGRVNTGFAFESGGGGSAQEGEREGSTLRFADAAEELQAASEAAEGSPRSVRARINTGFAFDSGASEGGAGVKFAEGREELEAASAATATGGSGRSVRNRVNCYTGFMHRQAADDDDDGFGEDEEGGASPTSTAFSASPQSATARKKLGGEEPSFALQDDAEQNANRDSEAEATRESFPEGTGSQSLQLSSKRSSLTSNSSRKGSKENPEHVHWRDKLVETADAASGGPSPRRTRSVRSRVATGFMTDLDTQYDSDDEVSEALMSQAPSLSRSSSGLIDKDRRSSLVRRRISLSQDARRSNRLSAKSEADEKRKMQHATVGAEFNLPMTGPEVNIDDHIDDDFEKDMDLLTDSLRPLSLFSELPDEVLQDLIEAMQVFSYEDGENVVEEGDTGGTHFFVIAEGQVSILKGGQNLATLNKGTPFGESVLLIDGHRAATVQAKGPLKVYGLEAQDVRDAMHYNYELQYKEVMVALTQILADDNCEQLSRLNAFQTHALFQGSEVKHVESNEVIVEQGHISIGEVYVLVQGAVVLRKGGADVRRVKRNTMFGMQGLLFDYMPFEAVADGNTTLLVIPKSTVMELYDKAQSVPEILMRPLLMDKLQRMEHQHINISEEQREELAQLYHVVKVEKDTVLSDPNIKMVMGLDSGGVEVSTDNFAADIQQLSGDTHDMAGIDHILNPEGCLDLQIRATEPDFASHCAIWYGRDISGANDADVHSDAMQKSIIQILKNIFLFKTLGQKQLETLAAATHTRHYKDGETVFNQGDKGDFFCIVGHGRVIIMRNGRYIRALSRFDYFGERALLTHEPRAATVEASGECAIWVISSEAFNQAMPEAALNYLRGRISLQDSDYTFDDLIFIRMIGSGGFGSVKMVQKKGGGKADRYALKCVLKQPVVENNQTSMLINERSILTEIDHPFIVKLVQTFKNDAYVYFLLELVSGGELLEALQVLGLLNLSQAQFYTGSVVLALEHLHDRRIAYLDLKSENILIDYQGYIKLVDFGLAVKMTGARSHQVRGTPHFMTPEMILAKGYDTTADLWTLGVCVYEFLVGTLPFGHGSTKKAQIFQAVLNAPLDFPDHLKAKPYGPACTSFVQSLLTRDPHQRLGGGIAGYSDIRSHSFFEDFDLDALISRHCTPPYIPKAEKYAEETQSQIAKYQNQVLSKLEDDLLAKALSNGWTDPLDGWDDDFH